MEAEQDGENSLGWRAIVCLLLPFLLTLHTFVFAIATSASAAAEVNGLPFSVICHSGTSNPDQSAPGKQSPNLPDCCKEGHCVLCSGITLPAMERASADLAKREFYQGGLLLALNAVDLPLKEVGRSYSRSPRAPPF